MNEPSPPTPVINRTRRSREEWIEIQTHYRQSNQSQSEYCRQHQLSLATFSKWRRRLNEESSADFVAVVPETNEVTSTGSFNVRLELGDGLVLELSKG